MKYLCILLSLIYTIMSAACSLQRKADLAIINGKVLTIDSENPSAEAVAVKGETILAVGSTEKISGYIEEGVTEVIDAKGRLVIPGFNDAHVHFGPLDPDYIELRYTTDPSVITEKVKAQVARSKPGELIRGGHWVHELFPDKQWPAKELVDKISPDNPVLLSRADGHSVLVNSYVLKKSGITKNTPDPFGGEIQNAGWGDFEAYEKLQNEGELTSRIDLGAPLSGDTSKLEKYLETGKKYPGDGNWIRFGYLKAFADGSIGSSTALMFEPYTDNPATSGLAMWQYEDLEKMVLTADKMGFQIGIHAIGDKANNWILNAFEKAVEVNGKRDSRHRDEHNKTVQLCDIPRFAQLGVIPSMQPTHCISDKLFYEKRVGFERCKGTYAWRSLIDAGSTLAFGTDYQVEPLNPMA